MNFGEVVSGLADVHRKAVIYVPRDATVVDERTPVLLLVFDDEDEEPRPEGWRYLLEVLLAREVLEVWSDWRDGRVPSLTEACAAIAYYADYDAYQPES